MTMRKAMRPRDVANGISACIEEGNIDNVLDFFHPDYTMLFPPTESPKSGLETIREVFSDLIDAKHSLVSKVTGEVINGETALLQANWIIKDSTGAVVSGGSSTEVLKQREDGSWVYYIDCPMGLPLIQ
ncbi:MAG TPA: hypothetical protein DCS93_14775 [Microscillaceae bacterium]|nr:hypothetical protein [Microscillaceae bacterium]